MASPTNVRLDWKGLPGTNALAYYDCKKFYNIAPNVIQDSRRWDKLYKETYTRKKRLIVVSWTVRGGLKLPT